MTTNKESKSMNIATFSIVGRSIDGAQIGVAVASRFLAVGSYEPAATIHGALATQANTNMALRTEGLAMLEEGTPAKEVLEKFFEADSQKNLRQAGMVDANGGSATFTGKGLQALGWWSRRVTSERVFCNSGEYISGTRSYRRNGGCLA